jgi:RNA polymerase sigma factor (sigma-70 family)
MNDEQQRQGHEGEHDETGETDETDETGPADSDGPPLTAEQQARVRTADGLVESRVAWHLSKTPAALHLADDLLGVGRRALTEASRRFSTSFLTAFKTYARYPVDGAILDAIAREAREHDFKSASAACLRAGALAHPTSPEDTVDPMADDEVSADRKLRRALGQKAVAAALAFVLQLEERLEQELDPERRAALRRLGGALGAAFGRLPERDQEMLRCLYALGMDLGEVASLLGLAYPTVKVRHAKVLGLLRDDLTTQGFSSSVGE